MIDPAHLIAHPVVSFALRVAFGGYIAYLAREFYADPFGYFRRFAPRIVTLDWLAPVIRGMAAFCLWGGCFIVATAIAVQIFGLHGYALAVALVVLAALGAWLLLPRRRADAETGANRPPSSPSKQDRPPV